MTEFRNEDRDIQVQRDENGMIIMPSERPTEPPPKTGGLAGVIFVAIAAVAGIGGYFWMENAPPPRPLGAQEQEIVQQDEILAPVHTREQQLAMNETASAPVERRLAPPAPVETLDAPMPDSAPPIAVVDPIAPPPPMNLSAPPTRE